MEQKDYLLREIEKIGLILSAVRQKLFGSNDDLAIHPEQSMAEVKGMLLDQLNLNMDDFLCLGPEETDDFLARMDGFNIDNIEELADCISQIGFSMKSNENIIYLKKALQLYELIAVKSKTFSFERESKISAIKDIID